MITVQHSPSNRETWSNSSRRCLGVPQGVPWGSLGGPRITCTMVRLIPEGPARVPGGPWGVLGAPLGVPGGSLDQVHHGAFNFWKSLGGPCVIPGGAWEVPGDPWGSPGGGSWGVPGSSAPLSAVKYQQMQIRYHSILLGRWSDDVEGYLGRSKRRQGKGT